MGCIRRNNEISKWNIKAVDIMLTYPPPVVDNVDKVDRYIFLFR